MILRRIFAPHHGASASATAAAGRRPTACRASAPPSSAWPALAASAGAAADALDSTLGAQIYDAAPVAAALTAFGGAAMFVHSLISKRDVAIGELAERLRGFEAASAKAQDSVRAELIVEMRGVKEKLGSQMADLESKLGSQMGGAKETLDAKVAGLLATARAEAAAAAMAAVKDYGASVTGDAVVAAELVARKPVRKG